MEFRFDQRDIRFVLFEVLEAHRLGEHERFADINQETMEMILDEAYKFSKDVIAPTSEVGDTVGCSFEGGKVHIPKPIASALKEFGTNGWNAMIESPDWGGQGLPQVLSAAANEMFIAGHCALALMPMLTSGAAHLIDHFGSDELKKTYLEKMYSLHWAGTMCLTEPQAGSDVGNSKTKAIPRGDGTHTIIGTKNFITGGDHEVTENIIHLVLARTEGAPAGTRGLSLFVVPKYKVVNGKCTGESNDVACAGIEHKMGIKGTPTGTITFGDEERCVGYMVGEEFAGMRLMFHLMNEARVWVGIQGLALATASYQHALQYARERLQGSHTREFKNPDAAKVPIVAHPDIRRMLMTMKTWTEAIRSMLLFVGHAEDKLAVTTDPEEREKLQNRIDLLTPICKAYSTDVGFEMTSLGIQVLGGYGYCREFPQEQFMRDIRIAAIYEGSNGIQAMDLLARKLTMKKGALFADFMNEVNQFVAKNKQVPAMKDLAETLGVATRTLAVTTMKLGAGIREDLERGLMQAVPFLRLMGHVVMAYELAKQAVIANAALDRVYAEKGADTDEKKKALYDSSASVHFYVNKLHCAAFFHNRILPEVGSLSAQILSPDRSALDIRFTLEAEF
jgi:hypothetical protein